MFRIISGALDPSAMRVRFARVGFHIKVFLTIFCPSFVSVMIVRCWEVMTSMESIKISEMIEIPMNRYETMQK